MRSIFLLALLLALCTAAPVDKHGEKVSAKDGHVHEVAENVPADNHEENDHEGGEKVKEGTLASDLHREEKFFSHNEFELGDIGVSGTAEGGSISIGHQIEIDVHGHTHSHAVNGRYGEWSAYGTCSKTCGDGIKKRSRACTKPEPQHDGLTCEEQNLGPATETKECNLRPCPINGGYTFWSDWSSPCSVSCGGGTQSRSRKCTNPEAQHDGLTCDDQVKSLGSALETKACNQDIPCPINGGYSPWSDWSAPCSVSCGGGTQSRSRECTSPLAQHGGLTCEKQNLGPDTETKDCNLNPCPVNGGYTTWSDWSAHCSVSCGGGTQSRSRECTSPVAQHGGLTCEDQKQSLGSPLETKACNQDIPCPINGGYSAWSDWSAPCSVSCGGGTQSRSRKCTSPVAQHGGLTCEKQSLGPDTETRECNLNPCPINGGYTTWSDWNESCSVSCGGGTQSRSRECTNPEAQHGGLTCEQNLGPDTEFKICNPSPCPINGGYNTWSEWSAPCSVSCGGGTQSRSRECTSPEAQHDGLTCEEQNLGPDKETKECNPNPCPINGGYTTWSDWSCSVSCGRGTQLRSRSCTSPEAQHDGLTCEDQNLGPDKETKDCNLRRCPECSCSDLVKEGGFGNCEKEFMSMGFICWVNTPSTCTDVQENLMDPGNFYSAEACKSGSLPSICSANNAQYYPDPMDCSKFYQCSVGQAPIHQSCPDTTLWSSQLNICDFASNVQCQEKVGFEACVDSWCLHEGTDEKYTRCESATDGGDTCVNPLIKYGETGIGIPVHDGPHVGTYCKMFFDEERFASVTTGERDCSAATAYLYWCDEDGKTWCDIGNLGKLDDCRVEGAITSFSCRKDWILK